ncbi:MAG: hypothetical protein KKF56_03170 [Nanoarchaeota archaeon]|nr:hypothetical protein [Nanoarchaeota archaeon]
MPKNKLATPEWIIQGFDSLEEYNKSKGITKEKKTGKTFNIRRCPECKSDDVVMVVGGNGLWKCNKCKWEGMETEKEELSEEEFMKYLDDKGEETS